MNRNILRNIDNYCSADEAVMAVRTGDHIHLGSIASVPHVLIDALCRRAERGEVENLHFHHFRGHQAIVFQAQGVNIIGIILCRAHFAAL